jgi:hypothetical protein
MSLRPTLYEKNPKTLQSYIEKNKFNKKIRKTNSNKKNNDYI